MTKEQAQETFDEWAHAYHIDSLPGFHLIEAEDVPRIVEAIYGAIGNAVVGTVENHIAFAEHYPNAVEQERKRYAERVRERAENARR